MKFLAAFLFVAGAMLSYGQHQDPQAADALGSWPP